MWQNSQVKCQRSKSASDISGRYQYRYERALDAACERNVCLQSQANGDYCKSKYERALNDACGGGLVCLPHNYGNVTTDYNTCNTGCAINEFPNRNRTVRFCSEEKFSNMVPPAFLAKDFVPYRIKKRRSCTDCTVQRPPLTTVKCCISPECVQRFCRVCRIEPAPPCNIQSCPRRNPPSFLVLPMTAPAVAPSSENDTSLPQPSASESVAASKASSKAHSRANSRRHSPANGINSKISSRRTSPGSTTNDNKTPIASSRRGAAATKSNTAKQNQPTTAHDNSSLLSSLKIDIQPITIVQAPSTTSAIPAPQAANGLQDVQSFESKQPTETGYPVRSQMALKSDTAQPSSEKMKIAEANYSVQSKPTSKRSSAQPSNETMNTVDEANKELKEKVLAAYDNYNKCMEKTGHCCYKPIEFCSCLKVKSDKSNQKESKNTKNNQNDEQNTRECCPSYPTYHQTSCCVVPQRCPVYDPEELNEDDVFDTNVDINTDYKQTNNDHQNKDEQRSNKKGTNSEGDTATTSKASCNCEGENPEDCICAPAKSEDTVQSEQQDQAQPCQLNCNRCCPWYMYGCYPVQPPHCNMYSYCRGVCCHYKKCCCWRCRNSCYTTLPQLQQRQDQQRATAEYYTKTQNNGYDQMARNYEQYTKTQTQTQPQSIQSTQSNEKKTTAQKNNTGRVVAGAILRGQQQISSNPYQQPNSPIYTGNNPMGLPYEYGAPFMRWQKFFSCPTGGYIMYGNQCTINPY